jgi:hypothetical protein
MAAVLVSIKVPPIRSSTLTPRRQRDSAAVCSPEPLEARNGIFFESTVNPKFCRRQHPHKSVNFRNEIHVLFTSIFDFRKLLHTVELSRTQGFKTVPVLASSAQRSCRRYMLCAYPRAVGLGFRVHGLGLKAQGVGFRD